MHRVAGSGVGGLELLRLARVLGQLQPVHAFRQAAAGRVLPPAEGPHRQLCLQRRCNSSGKIRVGSGPVWQLPMRAVWGLGLRQVRTAQPSILEAVNSHLEQGAADTEPCGSYLAAGTP